MEDDREVAGIMVVRLFPLPGVVSFPHCVLPLHIFEPRYRRMTEDALEGDRLITIVMIRPDADWKGNDPPALEEFGCVGRILKHERLPDGRFNLLLLGVKRIRILREVSSVKPYRSAEVRIVDDADRTNPELTKLHEPLIKAFRRFLERARDPNPELDALLDSGLDHGVLADLLAHSLPLPPAIKQELLAEPRVVARVRSLIRLLIELAELPSGNAQAIRNFPPSFSQN